MLATARSFHRHGISFVAVGLAPSSVMGVSRYLRPYLAGVGPDARSEPHAYVDFLLDVVRRRGVGLVFPLTDRTLLTCDRFRDAIEAEARLAAPPSAAIRNVLDKKANLATARTLGIPCPAGFDLEHMEQVPELIEALGFPLVLKQPGPPIEGERPRLDLDWVVVRDEPELVRQLTKHAQQGVFPVVQELVVGMSQKLCCFAVGGEVVAAHQWRHIRSFRGFSVFRETTAVSPVLYRYAEMLLEALRWEGLAHLEFKVRDGDGDVKYIETNGRPWGAIESSIASGWDFPVWSYNYFARGEKPTPPPPSRALGKRTRWHFGDLQALISFLGGREQVTWAGRSRVGAIVEYLSGFSPKVHSDVFRLDDPLPELAEHVRGARAGAYHVMRRIKPLRSLYRSVRALTTNNS
jgi:predicted ATP-grasp superfamily ATP-dependent carboligase